MVGGRRLQFTQPGSVTRITMKNFMTYKHETVYPGPNFNVTVGPNGSGKSSIVTALSIALGGELSSLNRQLELKSLINTEAGNNPAEIEIELFNKDGANTVVKAQLNKDSPHPLWWINNKVATQKQLLELTAKLQIQPGNLCQFLPQDVVREFPQMKPHTIFENTIKALGDLEMLNKLKRGEEIQQKLDGKEEELKTKQNTLTSYEQKEKRQEHDRKMLEEREELDKRKVTLDAAIKWAKFKANRKKAQITRAKKEELNVELIEVGKQLTPIKEFLEEFDRKKEALKEGLEKTEHELQEKGRFVQEFEITELEDELDRQVEKEKDITQDENNRIQKKERFMQEIKELEEKKLTCQFTSSQEEELKKLKESKIMRDTQIITKEAAIVELEQHIKAAKNDLNNLQVQKNNLNSAKARKLAVLERENQDAYRGVLWLRENTDKFKCRVHEPIMLCLDVKSEYARYVETHVGRADLEGFVCEDPDDLNLLLRVLREEKRFRRISAFHSSPKPRDSFRKPMSEEQLRKYGFQSYLSDMYEAPEAVNAFLCQQKNLHQVPLFEKDTSSTDELSGLFRSYYVGNSKYTVKQSKYSGELSKGEEDIGNRPVKRLKDSVDKSRLEVVEAEMEKKRTVLRNHETRLKQQNDTINKIKDDINQLQEKWKVLDGKRREAVTIERELEIKQGVVKTLVEPKVNIEAEKREIQAAKNKLVLDLCKTTLALKENVEACGLLDLRKQCKLLQIMNVESENREQTDARKQLEERDESIRAQQQDVNKTYAEHTKELQESHIAAKAATDGVADEKKKWQAPPEWIERFKELGESYNDITILDVMLEEVETDLKTKFKKFDTDMVRRMKENKEKLAAARESVAKLNKDIREKTKELEELRRGWIHGVRQMVGRVGDKFADMMATLGYSGEIKLNEGGTNTLDMKNYGIKILVKFRNDDTFQELSKGTQSGGEKSVTTAVYMMALQGLTQVPFRCVDEINQGMDERNERHVWDMLLKVCREHQAQYFYMAPKFPYSLPFDNQVTILICNKGNLDKNSHDSFSTQAFVEASRRSN